MSNDINDGIRLLAAHEYSSEWDRLAQLVGGVSYELWLLATVTLLVIAAIVWQTLARHRRRDFDYDSPQRLFAELCRAHKLSWANRRLLKHLAASRGLKSPAALFVEPEYFDMTNIPSALQTSAADLRHLRCKLFG